MGDNQKPALLHSAIMLLSNLMFGNDTNNLLIGRTCELEIAGVLSARQAVQGGAAGDGRPELLRREHPVDRATKCSTAAHELEDDAATHRRIKRGEQTSVLIVVEGGAKRERRLG